ncbi:MAG: zinc-binding dehydrogenase [Novosphingobium sp.]|nr:zinc-binding dehydrogenase [Novosphingobium sp.]
MLILLHYTTEIARFFHSNLGNVGLTDPAEREEMARFWFDNLSAGRIKVEIGQRYTLDECVQAHRDLEAGKTIGSSVFVL